MARLKSTDATEALKEGGSALLLALMAVAVLIAVVLVGLTMYLIFSSQKREQTQADSWALQAAEVLNSTDRIGQMNNMVARGRELVFTSRTTFQRAAAEYRHLEPLARQLLEESRQSARLMESERARMVKTLVGQLQEAMRQAQAEQGEKKGVSLPWMKTQPARLGDVAIGYIEGVQSNVEASPGNPELNKADYDGQYIEKASGLYKGNINARLPAPDNDLDFKLSSLPAPVKGSIALPRLTSPKVFRQTGHVFQGGQAASQYPDQLPSAVQVETLVEVATGDTQAGKPQVMRVGASATTGGAAPPP